MSDVFPDFQQARVLVVGDVMLDRYWHGATSRISQEAPVPVVQVDNREDRPGAAANVALNLAALGASVSLYSATGDDETADILTEKLTSVGVDCYFQRLAETTTTIKLRVMSQNQQLIRLDFEHPLPELAESDWIASIKPLLESVQVVIVSDYNKGVMRHVPALIALAQQQGKPVLVDPKGKDFTRYQGAYAITPNLQEFEAVVGACTDEAELVARGQQLIETLQLTALLITRGSQGMTLLHAKGPEQHLPAHAREVYDVTGAGDTVIATLAAALAAQADLPQAVALANAAAAIAVGRMGTAAVSFPELYRATRQAPGTGVMRMDQLRIAVQEAKKHGDRIVMTNGCFDIIHAGHVGYLHQAKQQGDRLIVAVNSDASVTRLKGAGRPVNPLARRMAVLAALESVDWVTSFDEATPEALLAALQPDVLAKGGDYAENEVVGHELVTAYGGKIAVLTFFEKCSTTAIVDKIRDQVD